MATTTSDQQIRIPQSSDSPDVVTAFTNAVADLESRLVHRYTSSADRTTRLPSPVAGQVTWLGDVTRLEYYDGSAHQALASRYVGSATQAATVSTTTVEVVGLSLTFTAVVGLRYRVVYNGAYQSSAANDQLTFKLRYKAGATLDSSGTAFRNVALHAATVGQNLPITVSGVVSGIAAGQTTIGITIVRGAGTGTVQLNTSPGLHEGFLELYAVGV